MLALFAVMILSSGCATRSHIVYDGRTEAPGSIAVGQAQTDPHFVYAIKTIAAENSVVDQNRRYEIRRVSFPSIGDNGQAGNQVTAEYHRSLTPGTHPVVIVLPIWGRHVYPSNAIIRTLRKRSNGAIHVLNVLGEDFLIDWPGLAVETNEDRFMELWIQGAEREMTTVIDMRRLVDWAESQPEIDGDHVGLIGFSHGAIFAPTLASQEPRISTLVLVMGGAHPHSVIARCIGARTEGVQLWAEESFGWSRDEMEDRLKPIYGPMDPTNYPDRVDPSQVLMIDAGKDECVPKSCRDDLWEVMGQPERWIINANHRHAFYTMTPLNLNWMQKKIWKFCKEHLLGHQNK